MSGTYLKPGQSAKFIPDGSYLQTCQNVQVRLTGYINYNGQRVSINFDLTNCHEAYLVFENGQLVNKLGSYAPDGFIPAGPYRSQMEELAVVLHCSATKLDGNHQQAWLDLTKLKTADIANINGRLVDMSHVAQANEHVAQMYPQLKPHLVDNGAQFQSNLRNNTAPAPSCPPIAPTPPRPPVAPMSTFERDMKIIEAVGVVVVDVVLFLLSLLGLQAKAEEPAKLALAKDIEKLDATAMGRLLIDFRRTASQFDKAKIIFKITNQAINVSLLKSVIKECCAHMSVWEWVKSVVGAVAQFIAWTASDGVAFVAEVALRIESAVGLYEDVDKAVKVIEA
jgi:hypothetical protein